MARTKIIHRCTDCGATSPKWAGRCPSCDAWNSLVEDVDTPEPGASVPMSASALPVPISDVDAQFAQPQSTGIAELDRVLGGGLVPGSVTLLVSDSVGMDTPSRYPDRMSSAGGRPLAP